MPRKKTRQEFINEAVAVHGNKYDYSKVEYKDNKTKVEIVCPEHGPFSQSPRDHLSGNGCKDCAKERKSQGLRMTQDQFIEKSRSLYGNKYDYSKVQYVNLNQKVLIVCSQHNYSFWQLPSNHLRGVEGCYWCSSYQTGSRKLTYEEFIGRAKEQHGDKYDYSKVEYEGSKQNVMITCPSHGDFKQRPNDHLNGQGCPSCYVENQKYYSEKWIERNPVFANQTCSVYLIKMEGEDESFLKLGITSKDVNKRYQTSNDTGGYDYSLIHKEQTTIKEGIYIENRAREHLGFHRYQPSVQFPGWTECFDLTAGEHILNIMKSL